jgi:predicted AAA+ superfamily ATPase
VWDDIFNVSLFVVLLFNDYINYYRKGSRFVKSILTTQDNYIQRTISNKIVQKLSKMPAVAILGPRQCGKTTLVKRIIGKMDNAVYLDLERRTDWNKLRDPEVFFDLNRSKLICLDEIQRVPDLFSEMRSRIDRHGGNGWNKPI